jgi:hypothetical protein
MAAAEAVFASEYDHISEDAQEPPAEAGTSKKVQANSADDDDDDEEMADDDREDDGEAVDVDLSGDDEDDGEEAGVEMDDDEDFAFDVDVDGDEAGLDTDAYGGLNMNKVSPCIAYSPHFATPHNGQIALPGSQSRANRDYDRNASMARTTNVRHRKGNHCLPTFHQRHHCVLKAPLCLRTRRSRHNRRSLIPITSGRHCRRSQLF